MPTPRSPEQLQESNQQPLLVKALASVANAVFITDEAGKIIWVNDAFTRLSGYSEEDAIGRMPSILQSGKQSESFYAKLWQTILAGHVWQGEVVDQRKDGSLYTVDEVITPLFNEDGVITNFIAIQHDITARKQEDERSHFLAYHDAVTGLPNRPFFLDAQKLAISHAKRTQHMLATLFLDIDGFKPVNDTFGHRMGDQLLSAIADRLRAAVRKGDTVARFGGDEFAVLLTGLQEPEIAAVLAGKLVDAISRPFMVRGQKLAVSASIGISIYPFDGEDAEILLDKADHAMYDAKHQGGNNFRFYQTTLSQQH